jgi:hypothetical protein
MAKGEQKGNRESKKPKKEKVKTIAAAPSQKGAAAGWRPNFGSGMGCDGPDDRRQRRARQRGVAAAGSSPDIRKHRFGG